MSIEEVIMDGVAFESRGNRPKEENKVKAKAKRKTCTTGLHGSGAAKIKAEIHKKHANRYKGR